MAGGVIRLVLSLGGSLVVAASLINFQADWLVYAYTVWSACLLWLIANRVGERYRAILSGLVDAAVLTGILHLRGTVSSPLIVLLMVLCATYALVNPRRIALPVAVATCGLYFLWVSLEAAGVAPYAPQGPLWLRGHGADWTSLLGGGAFISAVVLLATDLVGRLADRLRARERELLELSQHDGLTRLHNRRYFDEQLSVQLARVRRGRQCSLMMLDLDGFRSVNNRFGHAVGDDLLREIAAMLRRITRQTDVAARYGGDEMIVLLPDTDLDGAIAVAERIRQATAEVGRSGIESGVTASLGVTELVPDDGAPSALKRADELTYAAKGEGGDRVEAGQGASE